MLEMTGCEDVIAIECGTGTGLHDNESPMVFSVPFGTQYQRYTLA